MVELEYFTIMREIQMENLGSIDKKDWPLPMYLEDYRSKEQPDFNYYYPKDHFFPLGEWMRDYRAIQARKNASPTR
jgi:hypothetical protein